VAESGDDEVAVEAGGARHVLTRSVAETVTVQADPSPPARVALPEQLVLARERYGR
jgi:DtxR family Mn-dependent transcriptional regulator